MAPKMVWEAMSRRQELMGFFDEDHQRPGFVAMPAVGRLLAPHPGFVDAARQQVADQHVGGGVAPVLPELQHHVLAALQLFDDAAGAGAALPLFCQEPEPLPGQQAAVQRLQGRTG